MVLPNILQYLPSPVRLIGGVIVVVFTATIALGLYNVYLHPLSTYPGPRLAAATRIWFAGHLANGSLPFAIHELHQKYGDVVRIAPNELSYIHPEGWNEIYGHRHGKPEIIKDPAFYSTVASGPEGLFRASQERHGYLRKQLSHSFSEKAMREQEDTIRFQADLMISQLKRNINKDGTKIVNFNRWYNYFTFDVMGQLVFGESFNCLQNSDYHPWVKLIFDSVRLGTLVRCAQFWPWLSPVLLMLVPASIRRRRAEQQQLMQAKAEYRKAIQNGRQDLVSNLLQPDSGVSDLEYRSTVQSLIIAGSETTASLLCGVTYHLLKNVEKLERMVKEVRSEFDSSDKISFVSVNRLPYLLACLNEALRVYPPVADAFPRNTGPNVEVIMGQPVPPNTIVRMTHWATFHSPRNFTRPDEYIPERWLTDELGFVNDQRSALQPFQVGLAIVLVEILLMEMRLLMALVLWNFDLELCTALQNWDMQRAFVAWERPDLMVKLLPT